MSRVFKRKLDSHQTIFLQDKSTKGIIQLYQKLMAWNKRETTKVYCDYKATIAMSKISTLPWIDEHVDIRVYVVVEDKISCGTATVRYDNVGGLDNDLSLLFEVNFYNIPNTKFVKLDNSKHYSQCKTDSNHVLDQIVYNISKLTSNLRLVVRFKTDVSGIIYGFCYKWHSDLNWISINVFKVVVKLPLLTFLESCTRFKWKIKFVMVEPNGTYIHFCWLQIIYEWILIRSYKIKE